MTTLSFDTSKLASFVGEEELSMMQPMVSVADELLRQGTGVGAEYTDWLHLPTEYDKDEFARIQAAAKKIQSDSKVLVVVGIGGSYLGAKAVIDLFSSQFSNMESLNDRKHPQIIFAGNNMSAKYIYDLIEYIKDKDVAINVISKSGTTLEPAMSFRILRMFLEEKYGIRGAAQRIYVTTDANKGVLHDIAVKNEYEMFVIPDNVGGRYSVLTPVGLLPMAVANIDIDDILDGALFASHVFNQRNIKANDCYKYAIIRNVLYQKGKKIELLASYEPSFRYFIEWYKQLFGESEGKENKGIFPAGVNFTTDLHSMGQFIQQGTRNIFETVINVEIDRTFIKFPEYSEDDDNLNYLSGKEIDHINKQAYLGTLKAHVDGGVPVMVINMEDVSEYNVGQLIFFFEKACAISGYMLGVNPFDQPGVEAYKKNMMSLLKKD